MSKTSPHSEPPNLPAESSSTAPDAGNEPTVQARHADTQNRVAEISSLLHALEEAATESGLSARASDQAAKPSFRQENRLVQARLGMAHSLFTALRYKHPQTASHSLRVALGCSSWAIFAELDEATHNTLELAALLHDVGKIGIPDAILLKPSRLSLEELTTMNRHREIGVAILAASCGDDEILEAVRYAGVRYDGKDSTLPLKGDDAPLAARMITIVDAFDSMTTDHVYRRAEPRERALSELFEYAGTQFDPQLVKQFVEAITHRQDALTSQIADRWLGRLAKKDPECPWELSEGHLEQTKAASLVALQERSMFEQKLIDSMRDGVAFVDTQSQICLWSKGAERLTGIAEEAAKGRLFLPSLLEMCNHSKKLIEDDACPVAKALRTNSQVRQRVSIIGRLGKHVAVDLQAIPVMGLDGALHGATVILHDAQPEASLEERCDALHAEVTRDPMTKVANRAEFDRMQGLFIEAHQQAGLPCSLIMIDIDHFKVINDTYGHQAGDEAIISLANLLSSLCRGGDLVARYGGEEFAVLCADCTVSDAARRAEQMRKKLSEIPHACLANKHITASFGVTELQAGDKPETMLRRADRALLMAKEQGRNQVVQLGNGMEKDQTKKKWWPFGSLNSQPMLEASLVSAVPIDIAIEKLRGFVSDHKAKIIATRENCVELEMSSETVSHDRRRGDRHVVFRVELQFTETHVHRSNNLGFASGEYAQTRVDLQIRPKRSTSRRKADVSERAFLIQQSIKAYLMAKESDEVKAEMLSSMGE